MDLGRTVYTVAQIYVGVLLVTALLTAAVVFDLFGRADAQLAGIWLGVLGFGFLVAVTFLLIHLTRE